VCDLWGKKLKNEEAMARVESQGHKKKAFPNEMHFVRPVDKVTDIQSGVKFHAAVKDFVLLRCDAAYWGVQNFRMTTRSSTSRVNRPLLSLEDEDSNP
jgi:hypothetical protein